MTDKLDLQSPDITSLNIEKIAALFPNCVTEAADGKKIDFDLLKQELSTEIVDGTKERYRLEWPGKREAIVTANLPTNNTLRPVREDSVDFDTTENIYIEGDNLEVLKLLQESYLNKIKMIYIDPPYNTGKDFVYKDNFSRDGAEELFESGQKDEYNQRLVANPETSGRYHSDWLSMMYPRLKLARNLLTEDGVIFISIDDNEVHNLRKICDEVFGEGNFVSSLIWKSRQNKDNRSLTGVSNDHEYLLTYTKSFGSRAMHGSERKTDQYKNPDNDPRGLWTSANMVGLLGEDLRPNCHYDLINPETNLIYKKPKMGWRYDQKTMSRLISENRILWPEAIDGRPRRKVFLNELSDNLAGFSSFVGENIYTRNGTNEIDVLFGHKYFDFPKPSELINDFIKQSTNQDSIILDFFSGSATTAHAVMQLNAEDQGSRKYIMVQLPEATDEKSEAYKAGYATICEIGKERIRRAAKKIKEEKIEKAKKDGLFADFKDEQDYGFRVYRLDASNMQDVYYKPQDYNQNTLDLFADNVKKGRTAEDLLTQIMLDWGLPLSLPIERKTISGKEVYAVAGDSLYCCFDNGIDEAFSKEIATEKPLRIVFRDSGFKDDTAKENVKQLLKQLSPATEMRVI